MSGQSLCIIFLWKYETKESFNRFQLSIHNIKKYAIFEKCTAGPYSS